MPASSIIMSSTHSVVDGCRGRLFNVIDNLPNGPKAFVVHHRKDDIMLKTMGLECSAFLQTDHSGTGGAILAAMNFIVESQVPNVIITNADMPFTHEKTYRRMIERLNIFDLVVLGFEPPQNKKHGVLEIEDGLVYRHTEWGQWEVNSSFRPGTLAVCSTGVYAVKKEMLVNYLPLLAHRPRILHKVINGEMLAMEEYCIEDLIKFMVADGKPVGCLITEDRFETLHIEDAKELHPSEMVYKPATL